MTYREYKPKWLNDDVFVDIYGREYNLSDVPMTYMKRREAYQKRGYSDEQIDEIGASMAISDSDKEIINL